MYDKPIHIRGINNGYQYFIDTTHPLRVGNSGMVYLHRHVASIHANRWVSIGEVVHHIDTDKLNNSSDNLQILSELEHQHIHHPPVPPITCCNCSTSFIPDKPSSKYCSPKCSTDSAIKNRELTKELLDSLIPNNSWIALGKMFKYSDVGIKKRAEALGCTIPIRRSVAQK